MSGFTRPENALSRAEDLINVGQKDQALQTLHDIITSRKYRTWSKTLEDIMLRYISLCVEMRKGKHAKEGLHQYKLVCQQVNVGSLEIVIKKFLELAESRAEDAKSKAGTVLDVEDLDASEESAESFFLTAVSGESQQDRTDRELVTPWLRFLWETYRTVLDTLRHSAKLEQLYHDTARLAFNFCLSYQRKNEFRRLSDILRGHLANIGKYSNQPQNVNLNNPETLQINLETRFAQLNVATELELWQESFRSVEDIHGLMTMSQKPLKPQMMSIYFRQLTRIFWVSNNYLFHAYALYKYFSVSFTQLKEKEDEFRQTASAVLLAALSIPLATSKSADEQFFEFDLQKEKNLRMGALLGFNVAPKRETLLQELVNRKIFNFVLPELQDVYQVLEKKFNPLQLCRKMNDKFAFLSGVSSLTQYTGQLQKLTFLRLLQQLSQVYDTMKINDFKKMVTFMDTHQIEKLLVSYAKQRVAGVRIDHQNAAIHFNINTETDQMRDQLTQLARGLKASLAMIQPKPQVDEVKAKEKSEMFVQIINSLSDEHNRLLVRKTLIEKRKQDEEKRNAQQAMKDQIAKNKQAKEAAQKLAQENTKAQKEREKERERIQKAKSQEAKSSLGELGVPAQQIDAIENPQAFIDQQILQYQKQKREQEKKIQTLSKEMFYMERALRDVERPILEEQRGVQREKEKKSLEEQQQRMAAEMKEKHARELEEKRRLGRMSQFRAVFEERIMGARRAEYTVRKADQDSRLAEVKAKVEAEKEERRKREQEENERRAALKAKQEEEERERKAAEEAKRAEEESARLKQREIMEKQRKREEEVMAKQRKEEEEARQKRDSEREDRWKKEEPRRGDDNRWKRDEPRRDERREEEPRRPDDRWGRRDEPRREERREEEPRRPDDRWGRRDEPRRDERREEEPRRDDNRWNRREEEPRRDDNRWRRDEPRREEPRREEPRREEPRREEPRREEPRREEPRREEPRRDDDGGDRWANKEAPARRQDDRWRRDDRREPERRGDDRREPERREPERRGDDRREPERRGDDRREPARREERREPEKREAEKPSGEKEEEGGDGFTQVGGARRRR